MTDEKLLSADDLGAVLRMHRKTVLGWRQSGCPSYRVVGMARFRLSEVKAWLEARKSPPRAPRPPAKRGLIYFVGATDGSPIKIGWTVRVDGRIPALQTGAWTELVCHGTISGTVDDERAIHAELAAHHVRGEWFQREPALTLLAGRIEGMP